MMWATLLLATVLAAPSGAMPTASPTPDPAPLRVILIVKSSTACSAVRTMAVPVGYVSRRNDEGIAAVNRSMLTFLSNNRGVGGASASDIAAMSSELDDVDTYTPENGMSVMRMGKTIWQLQQNLALEYDLMDTSRKQYPPGTSEPVDAMRQRLQNIIVLQSALINRYSRFVDTYKDNMGDASFHDDPGSFKALLRSSIYGQASALVSARKQTDPEILPQADAKDISQFGTPAAVARELRLQELAFSSEIVKAGTTCGI